MKTWIDYLTKLSITIAVIGFLMSFAISYQSYGMAQGLAVGHQELDEFKAEINYVNIIHFPHGMGGTYDHLSLDYGRLCWLFAVYLVATLLFRIKNQPSVLVMGHLLAGLSSILILYQLRTLVRDKGFVDSSFWDAPRNAFAQLTITHDWILIGFTVCLVGIQFIVILLKRRQASDALLNDKP